MGRSKTYLHCAFVLLLSWPAPLPVVHAHADYFAGATNWRELAEHVAFYHESQEPFSVDPDTPHCHWLFVGAGLDAPMQAAPLEVENGAASRFATGSNDLPSLFIGDTACWLRDAFFERRLMRRDSGYDSGRAEGNGLAFHRLFCVWTC